MALDDDATFGAKLSNAASGGNAALASLNLPQWLAIAAVINAQLRLADVDPTVSASPMMVNVSGTPTPVTGTGKIT